MPLPPIAPYIRVRIRRYIVVWIQALLPVASQTACKVQPFYMSASPAAPGYDPFALAFLACSGYCWLTYSDLQYHDIRPFRDSVPYYGLS